ncbi:Hypothetical protein NGAL_HAMBI2605_62810 [Neorhizobium galegae bv. orientalis]|nr:Hypothetical protein NGAL_HAMBI2605_62810 [Neorhizobium galegae bv. orientalis]
MTIEADETALVLRCREIGDIAVAASVALSSRMKTIGQDSFVYTFKSRIKPSSSILAKVKRKREDDLNESNGNKEPYSPDHVTDTWGSRYVTLYQSQIPDTVKALLTNFDAYNAEQDRQVELIEFVIYTNRPEKDPLSITEETLNVLKHHKISSTPKAEVKKPENRKSAYSSVHLIFSYPVDIDLTGKGRVRETAKFEVQIRDIFEEGWGEIQHNLIYSGKDKGKPSSEAALFDPLWQPHLNALKTFVDGCSQHASIIKRSYDFILLKSMPSLENESTTTQLNDREAILKAFGTKASSEAVHLVTLAYNLYLDAQAAPETEAQAQFVTAAGQFNKAMKAAGKLLSEQVSARSNIKAGYFLRMEEANSEFFSRVPELQKSALAKYRSIAEEYPDDATVHVRLAHALGSVGGNVIAEVSDALDIMKKAIMRIANDKLTGPDHWINISSRIHLGYLSWRMSQLTKDNVYLKDAISFTAEGYSYWRDLKDDVKKQDTHTLHAHKALSNLLYFTAKFVMSSPDDKDITKEKIKYFLEEIEKLDVPSYLDYYKTRDNLMHAYLAIGDVQSAKLNARENLVDLRKIAEIRAGRNLVAFDVESFLNVAEKTNYQTAAAMLADAVGS